MIVSMAVGGSTNVVLHAPEIARAAGFNSFWGDIMSPKNLTTCRSMWYQFSPMPSVQLLDGRYR